MESFNDAKDWAGGLTEAPCKKRITDADEEALVFFSPDAASDLRTEIRDHMFFWFFFL